MRASAGFTTSHALEPEYRESHFSFRKLDPKSKPPAEFQHSWRLSEDNYVRPERHLKS